MKVVGVSAVLPVWDCQPVLLCCGLSYTVHITHMYTYKNIYTMYSRGALMQLGSSHAGLLMQR